MLNTNSYIALAGLIVFGACTSGGLPDAPPNDGGPRSDAGVADAGQTADAGPAMDAGSADAGFDGGSMGDGGSTPDAGSLGDGGMRGWTQEAYVKASNPAANDYFGNDIALSSDGNTMAVIAYGEASNAVGVNGDQANNSAPNSGAVYVYRRTGTSWVQEAYLKSSNAESDDLLGNLSLSADGNVLVVGASGESSNAVGINGNQADNSAINSGAAYIFRRTGGTWAQDAYLKSSNPVAGDAFGAYVSMSRDGQAIAIGAPYKSSNQGEVYVFRHGLSGWTQEAELKALNAGLDDKFGWGVSIDKDGTTVAVGAHLEDSNATGVNGNPFDNSASASGAVYVFRNSLGGWVQEAYVKASNTKAQSWFGYRPSLSADGDALAVGALGEDSNATGVNGNQTNNAAINSGAVYLFRRTANIWAQEAYLKASNTDKGDYFGCFVSLSADGKTLAVAATNESSGSIDPFDNSMPLSGAVYVFQSKGGTWAQSAYLKASTAQANDSFGAMIAMSGDATTLAVSSVYEASNAAGINGNQNDNSAPNAGAVYVFRY